MLYFKRIKKTTMRLRFNTTINNKTHTKKHARSKRLKQWIVVSFDDFRKRFWFKLVWLFESKKNKPNQINAIQKKFRVCKEMLTHRCVPVEIKTVECQSIELHSIDPKCVSKTNGLRISGVPQHKNKKNTFAHPWFKHSFSDEQKKNDKKQQMFLICVMQFYGCKRILDWWQKSIKKLRNI